MYVKDSILKAYSLKKENILPEKEVPNPSVKKTRFIECTIENSDAF